MLGYTEAYTSLALISAFCQDPASELPCEEEFAMQAFIGATLLTSSVMMRNDTSVPVLSSSYPIIRASLTIGPRKLQMPATKHAQYH
jgi:hypothetical protein